MTIIMNDAELGTLDEVREFIKVSEKISFLGSTRKEKYEWIANVLQRFKYFVLCKKEKTVVKKYLMRLSGFSDAQMGRLVKKKKKIGIIAVARNKPRRSFPRVYTPVDIARLVETDLVHGRLSGPATVKLFERAYTVFHDTRFVRLKDISVSHLYNLRGTRQYQSRVGDYFRKTSSVRTDIGKRRKPNPQGKPGFLRVDTVHQGDRDKMKGVYHINIVDEVTQWEIVGAVEGISENFLAPLLELLLKQFPFRIVEFHSDNGGEYINHLVAKLLNKLLIEQTKSRARRTNDNALVEGKNGSVIRKHMGYVHIPQKHAPAINQFYMHRFNRYLNYHRPCGFATIVTDKKGKQKKIYDTYLTPYEKFRSLPDATRFLCDGITFADLEKIAMEKTDHECAQEMQNAKQKLFTSFRS